MEKMYWHHETIKEDVQTENNIETQVLSVNFL